MAIHVSVECFYFFRDVGYFVARFVQQYHEMGENWQLHEVNA